MRISVYKAIEDRLNNATSSISNINTDTRLLSIFTYLARFPHAHSGDGRYMSAHKLIQYYKQYKSNIANSGIKADIDFPNNIIKNAVIQLKSGTMVLAKRVSIFGIPAAILLGDGEKISSFTIGAQHEIDKVNDIICIKWLYKRLQPFFQRKASSTEIAKYLYNIIIPDSVNEQDYVIRFVNSVDGVKENNKDKDKDKTNPINIDISKPVEENIETNLEITEEDKKYTSDYLNSLSALDIENEFEEYMKKKPESRSKSKMIKILMENGYIVTDDITEDNQNIG